jgi:hypothetical protein
VHGAGQAPLERRGDAVAFFAEYFDLGCSEAPYGASIPALTALTVVGGIHEVLHWEILEGRTSGLPGLPPELVYIATLPDLGPQPARGRYDRRQKAAALGRG